MDKCASVLGALGAQKLPSQAQADDWIDWLVSQIDQVCAAGKPQLSSNGREIAQDAKRLLLAYKQLGNHKNYDDKLQDSVWNLAQGQIDVKTEEVKGIKEEVATDAQRLSYALHHILLIFWGHFTSFEEGSQLGSLIRNVLGDTAEVVEAQAGSAKAQLRETEEQVQRGERDDFGRERPLGGGEEPGARQKFEAEMEAAKMAGSHVIGTAQSAKRGAEEIKGRAARTFIDVLDLVLQRAENDEAYRECVTIIFDVATKWFNKSVEVAHKESFDDVVEDPSGHIPAALSSINTLLERLAAGKSFHEITAAFRTVAMDIRKDHELRSYFDALNDFVRRTLYEPTYARSEEHQQQREEFLTRWRQLQSGGAHQKWHEDLDKLHSEIRDYAKCAAQDRDVQELRDAYLALSKNTACAVEKLGGAADDTNWIWQDTLEVVLPRVLEQIRNLPIPRTEYKNTDVEFVVENLNVSSFRLLPGRMHIRNITDLDVYKESMQKEATTNIRARTHIRFEGVQLDAKDVSFWYHDHTMKPIPEISGLLGLTIPERGVDVDVVLGFIRQADRKSKDPKLYTLLSVQTVKVSLNNPHIDLRKTNHPILITAFKPIFRARLEHTIEATLEQQITGCIRQLDWLISDYLDRAEVFLDTGMAPSAAYFGALWSEIGHLRKQPSPFSGFQATSAGIVRDDPRSETKFAVGVQPQIIGGEKRGPEVPGSSMQERREQAEHAAEQAVEKVTSFEEEVKSKKEREKHIEGWRSPAFDICTQ